MIAPSSPVWVAHKPGAATAGKWSVSDRSRSQSEVETREGAGPGMRQGWWRNDCGARGACLATNPAIRLNGQRPFLLVKHIWWSPSLCNTSNSFIKYITHIYKCVLLKPLTDYTHGASVPFIVEVIWFEWCHCQTVIRLQRPDLQMNHSSLSTPCGTCLEEKSRKLYNWGII